MDAPERPAAWRPPTPLPDRFATDRLVLRHFAPDDAAPFLAAIDVDRASLHPWLPWARTDNRTIAEVMYNFERFRREREQAAPTTFAIGIFDRAAGGVLGGTSFHRLNHDLLEAEIGYWVRADRRRQGLCTEAVAGMLSWGFTAQDRGGWGFRRLHIRCGAANAASRRVPEKLGLPLEATFRKDRWTEGYGWDDTLAWSVLADEWDAEARKARTATT